MNWKNLFRFTPRAGREEFATVGLICNLLTFGNLLLSFLPVTNKFSSGQVLLIHLFSLPISLLVFWVGLALYSRRLHDLNLSLWWYFLYIVITSVFAFSSQTAAAAVSVLGIIVWAFFALKKGSPEANRFGATPEPFFPHRFRFSTLCLTAALGILVAAAMAGFSKYALEHSSVQPQQTTQTANF
ncbi:MAG: DUF805 domain-containing protein [Candidatus Avelusimicrobium sp.]|uniref:DUF805 domain-containing protein n=1 Tax=Candidatus Avelusimicrobium sp. TaxID=3048833 RepID=UPI003F0549DA